MNDSKLLIIIPAHNEEENIQGVLDELRRYDVAKFADVLIIDDASSDSTADIADQNGAHCIRFAYNLGYGNALQAGYKFATVHGYEYLIQMDADGQHDACNIQRIYQELCFGEDKPDMVLACRFMKESGPYETGPLMKLAFLWFRMLLELLCGEQYADSTTGLQGLNRRAFSYYARYNHFDSTYPDANMILQMNLLGFRILQIPAVMHHRMHGKGMHAGIIRPVKYMFRATASVIAVWARLRLLKRKE